eukprot:TRINITY_DN40703_c0_g1_i1.p1 TRINITY_DN40703_c0_g1~~TRINITY_DN40703_c0_g1_i1.p1  ORF type:complete len:360 (+),score=78.30 TRINITY_DN40703_c0_g1_i1:51-1082(+)
MMGRPAAAGTRRRSPTPPDSDLLELVQCAKAARSRALAGAPPAPAEQQAALTFAPAVLPPTPAEPAASPQPLAAACSWAAQCAGGGRRRAPAPGTFGNPPSLQAEYDRRAEEYRRLLLQQDALPLAAGEAAAESGAQGPARCSSLSPLAAAGSPAEADRHGSSQRAASSSGEALARALERVSAEPDSPPGALPLGAPAAAAEGAAALGGASGAAAALLCTPVSPRRPLPPPAPAAVAEVPPERWSVFAAPLPLPWDPPPLPAEPPEEPARSPYRVRCPSPAPHPRSGARSSSRSPRGPAARRAAPVPSAMPVRWEGPRAAAEPCAAPNWGVAAAPHSSRCGAN